MSDWRTFLEVLKVEADTRNMSPDEVRAVTRDRLENELGITGDNLELIISKGPQIVERVAQNRQNKIRRDTMQGIIDALTADQKQWLKEDGNFESFIHFVGRSMPPEDS